MQAWQNAQAISGRQGGGVSILSAYGFQLKQSLPSAVTVKATPTASQHA